MKKFKYKKPKFARGKSISGYRMELEAKRLDLIISLQIAGLFIGGWSLLAIIFILSGK
jgi:hypothetical protein